MPRLAWNPFFSLGWPQTCVSYRCDLPHLSTDGACPLAVCPSSSAFQGGRGLAYIFYLCTLLSQSDLKNCYHAVNDSMPYLITSYYLSSRMELSRSSVKGLPPGSCLIFHYFLFHLPTGIMRSLTEILKRKKKSCLPEGRGEYGEVRGEGRIGSEWF